MLVGRGESSGTIPRCRGNEETRQRRSDPLNGVVEEKEGRKQEGVLAYWEKISTGKIQEERPRNQRGSRPASNEAIWSLVEVDRT